MALTSAASGLCLVDKSALERRNRSVEVREHLEAMLADGVMASCQLIDLEVLYSARNLRDYRALQRSLAALPRLDVTTAVLDRALEAQALLARRGQHRVPLPDLIIAATAELNDAVVVHYDHDFDLIAGVTGQPARWIVPRGTAG